MGTEPSNTAEELQDIFEKIAEYDQVKLDHKITPFSKEEKAKRKVLVKKA